MGIVCRWIQFLITSTLLVLLLVSYSSAESPDVIELYNDSLAYWNFEDLPTLNEGIGETEGFCKIDGIHGSESSAVVVKRLTDGSGTLKSAKITLSSYSSSNCPTDPLACTEGFTVAFWLRLKNNSLNDTLNTNNCMLLSLNDTTYKGFQVMLNATSNSVSFKALGIQLESLEGYDATDKWIWNHFGMTWDNNTGNFTIYSNGERTTSSKSVNPGLLKAPGCIYTALDDIAIWDRPLTDADMLALRLDHFNITPEMTTPQQTTTEQLTTLTTTDSATTDTTTTAMGKSTAEVTMGSTKAATSAKLTLGDAVHQVENADSSEELIEAFDFAQKFLQDTADLSMSDGDNIKNILDKTATKIAELDANQDHDKILNEYMTLVNQVLEINKDSNDMDTIFISGTDLVFAVDDMLSSYIGSVNDTDRVISNPFVDTALSELADGNSNITLKMKKCVNKCSGFEVVVVIPSNVFDVSQTKKLASVSSFYEGVEEQLPTDVQGGPTKYSVASYVIGINVNAPTSSSFVNPVSIAITVKELNSNLEGTCAYLSSDKSWSTKDIETYTTGDSTTVTCKTKHLTNFAVLVSTRDQRLGKTDMLALQILTDVGLAISIICLILTLIILNVLRQLSSTRISILKHTAAALLAAQILFIVGASVSQVAGLCTAVASLMHYFFLAVFCWMLIQGVQLYMKVRRALRGSIDMIYFCVFGWGFPAIVVAISVGVSHTNYNGDSGVCWISLKEGVGTLIAFIGPAYLVLAINLVVICMVMHVFLTVKVNKDKSEMDKLKSGFKAVVVMVPILGVTWFFGLFLIISPNVVFIYLFVIFNCSQGLFIFLFHVVFNDEVKQAMVKKRNKIAASKDSNTFFSKAAKSKSGTEQSTTEATLTSGNQ